MRESDNTTKLGLTREKERERKVERDSAQYVRIAAPSRIEDIKTRLNDREEMSTTRARLETLKSPSGESEKGQTLLHRARQERCWSEEEVLRVGG